VTSNGAVQSEFPLNIVPDPVVESLSMKAGPIGTVVSLIGRNFTYVAAVQFAGVNASDWSVMSDELLRVKVPADACSGTLALITQGGRVVQAGDFEVVFPPTISSFVPNIGPEGTTVTVYGEHFDQPAAVDFGDLLSVDFNLVSDSVIELKVPPGASTAPITIHTKAGTVSTDLPFRVASPPKISHFSPITVKSGSTLTIYGEYLSDITEITIGNISATSFREVSPSELSVEVPTNALSGPVILTSLGGTSTSESSVNVLPQPVLKSFTPSSGGIGAKIMLTGGNLSGTNAVTFNGVAVTKLTVISSTFVSVEVPLGATTGPIEIKTAGGAVRSSTDFIVQPTPVISGVKPISGPVGAKVAVSGEDLDNVSKLFLNDRPVYGFTIESSQLITFLLPDDAQNGLIKVVSPGGTAVSGASFTVIPLPTISSFVPTVGPVGTVVTVSGTNLDRAISATVNGVAANVTAASAEKATVFVPANATKGPISIVTPYGYCVSAEEFSVVSSSAIKDILPRHGVAGSSVKISGWGFKGVLRVNFGPLESPSFTVNSTNAITAEVPLGAQTGPITVVTNTNDSISSKSFKVTLSVFSIEPTYGKAGTTILVSGIGLSTVTAVNVGGVSSEFVLVSDSSLKVYAPTNCPGGQVEVVASIGSTKSAQQYLYSAPQTADV